jgi:2,3-diketo-5-methylthio-1-phosphopentane phosphatase
VNASDQPAALDGGRSPLAPDAGSPAPLLGAPVPDAAGRITLGAHASALWRVPRARRPVVFCDFDGTFSVQDVGSTIARVHCAARRAELWPYIENGELTAWDYNMKLLDGLALPESELDAFLSTVELDPGAKALVAWCAERSIPFRVLSDGFDWNLDRLQRIHGVAFEYAANRLRYEDGRWRIAPGGLDSECPCGTGTCKRARIEAWRAANPGALCIHVGNGQVSDLCGALAADRVFAKDTLALALDERGVAYEPFETLHDVIGALERTIG